MMQESGHDSDHDGRPESVRANAETGDAIGGDDSRSPTAPLPGAELQERSRPASTTRPSLAASLSDLYDEVREVAARLLAAERTRDLGATSLVHEVYLRWSKSPSLQFLSRPAFFALAAQELRRVLVERSRRRLRRERLSLGIRVVPGQHEPVDPAAPESIDVLDLDEALHRLESDAGERVARVVELRYFTGLSVAETAEALEVSESTVKSDWRYARAFLRRQLDAMDAAPVDSNDTDSGNRVPPVGNQETAG